jgi:hypothetical protein
VAEATKLLSLADNDASLSFNIADVSSAFVGATQAQADAINAAVVANVSNPTAVGTLSVAEATKLLSLADNDASLTFNLSVTTPANVVDSTGQLRSAVDLAMGTSATVQQIQIGAGQYENNGSMIINKPIAIVGADGNATDGMRDVTLITPSGNATFVLQGNIAAQGTGDVSITGVKVVGGVEAVSVFGPSMDTRVDTLTITNSEFVGQSNGSVIVDLQRTASNLNNLVIDRVAISQDNTVASNDAKHQGIVAWGFDGNASISNVKIDGDVGAVAASSSPHYGILLMGSTSAFATPMAAGVVTLSDVTMTGAFAKSAVGIYNYTDISGVSGARVDVSATSSKWGQAVTVDGVDGSYNASNFGLVLGSNYTKMGVDAGTESNNSLTGTSGADVLYDGVGGNDTLAGGTGSDILTGGAGNDALVGGDAVGSNVEVDVSLVYSPPTFARVATGADQGKLTVTTAYDGTDTLTGVEVVRQMTVPTSTVASTLVKQFVLVDGAQNLQKAIDAAVTGDVVVTGGPLTISLDQANQMLAKGASFHAGDSVTLSATAAAIIGNTTALFAANTGDVVAALNIDAVQANDAAGNVGTLSVAGATTLLARATNDASLSFNISDSATNVLNVANSAVVAGAGTVSASDATIVQAVALRAADAADANTSYTYSIVDSAAAIEAEAVGDNGVLMGAINITAQVPGAIAGAPPVPQTVNLSVADAIALAGPLKGAYNIVDTADKVSLVPNWTAWSVGNSASVTVDANGRAAMRVGDDGSAVWTSGQTRSKAFVSTDTFNGQTQQPYRVVL